MMQPNIYTQQMGQSNPMMQPQMKMNSNIPSGGMNMPPSGMGMGPPNTMNMGSMGGMNSGMSVNMSSGMGGGIGNMPSTMGGNIPSMGSNPMNTMSSGMPGKIPSNISSMNANMPSNMNLGGMNALGSAIPSNMTSGGGTSTPDGLQGNLRGNQLFPLICDILIPEKRKNAMHLLSLQREILENEYFGMYLWIVSGVMSVLIQEIVSGYEYLSEDKMTTEIAERLCDALVLLQSVAGAPKTCHYFLNSQIPLYVYPFLECLESSERFERLRLTSLGVIAALFKPGDSKIIGYLLTIEIIPICLRIMEKGNDLNKLLATYIIERMLAIEDGLIYICATPDRFFAVSTVLAGMMSQQPEGRLVKLIIKCYTRLSDHPRAREALSQCLPREIRDPTPEEMAKEAETEGLRNARYMLLVNVGILQPSNPLPMEGMNIIM